ncbi:helix-turn-helix domain-containing protein [Amaricoccus macauensis]|uniref:helix-turn-helix domain-containing protein n=1 Tax=Amaricoccus macauensis TaxID=57001 RepID=UPI003C7C3941
MISQTLMEGLEKYRIGPKVRNLRKEKELSLAELGNHTGLSPGMLSKIETGQLFPTLPTLLRIALVFGVGLDHFFVDDEEQPKVAVVRRAERIRLPDRPDTTNPSYLFESLDFPVMDRRMESYLGTFPSGAPVTEPHRHDGEELIYVIDGALRVDIDAQSFHLGQGDAMYFDSSLPHAYSAEGAGACTAIVVVCAGTGG